MAGKNGKHPLMMRFVRRKAIVALHKAQGFSMPDARQMVGELDDDEILGALKGVAKTAQVELPKDVGAEGDHPFWDFLNAHWAEILAAILKILGL